jgi:hypothetical protein
MTERSIERPLLLVMEVIARLRDRALCASITSITGTYAEPEGRVIFDHRQNAAMRYVEMRRLNPTGLGKKDGLHLAASRSLRAESSKLSAPQRASHQGISRAQEIVVSAGSARPQGGGPFDLSVRWPPGATSLRGRQDCTPGVPRASRLSSPVQSRPSPAKG